MITVAPAVDLIEFAIEIAANEAALDRGGTGALSSHSPSRCPIFSELILPPGYACRIDINPDAAPLSVTVSVFYGGQGDMTFAERWWVGEITTTLTLLDAPDALQKILDGLTKRGVRAMPETR